MTYVAGGIGAPDGRLDLFELLIIFDTVCITFAGIIRLVVNSMESLNWNDDLISTMSYRGCLKFNWNTEVFMLIDKIYLGLCLFSLVSIIFVIWSILDEHFILRDIDIWRTNEDNYGIHCLQFIGWLFYGYCYECCLCFKGCCCRLFRKRDF